MILDPIKSLLHPRVIHRRVARRVNIQQILLLAPRTLRSRIFFHFSHKDDIASCVWLVLQRTNSMQTPFTISQRCSTSQESRTCQPSHSLPLFNRQSRKACRCEPRLNIEADVVGPGSESGIPPVCAPITCQRAWRPEFVISWDY